MPFFSVAYDSSCVVHSETHRTLVRRERNGRICAYTLVFSASWISAHALSYSQPRGSLPMHSRILSLVDLCPCTLVFSASWISARALSYSQPPAALGPFDRHAITNGEPIESRSSRGSRTRQALATRLVGSDSRPRRTCSHDWGARGTH
jgi:hypothetical protein